MIHPPDVVGKYAPDAIIGKLGEGGGDDDDSDDDDEDEGAGGGDGGYTAEEVAKHVSNTDCWVILHGQVLNVTSFLKEHPGGELAIMTFAGKDATHEFDMIHPPDVLGKYAPDAIIGSLGEGGGDDDDDDDEDDSDDDEDEGEGAGGGDGYTAEE